MFPERSQFDSDVSKPAQECSLMTTPHAANGPSQVPDSAEQPPHCARPSITRLQHKLGAPVLALAVAESGPACWPASHVLPEAIPALNLLLLFSLALFCSTPSLRHSLGLTPAHRQPWDQRRTSRSSHHHLQLTTMSTNLAMNFTTYSKRTPSLPIPSQASLTMSYAPMQSFSVSS